MGYSYGARSFWKNYPSADEKLAALAAQRKSSSEISSELSAFYGMDVTRNSVIGRARRLRIIINSSHYNNRSETPKSAGRGIVPPSRAKNSHLSEEKRQAPRAERNGGVAPSKLVTPKLTPKPTADEIAIPPSQRVSIFDLDHKSCRWPIGNPGDAGFGFCGATRVKPEDDSNAYCAPHAAIAYTPKLPRKITPEHRRAMLAGKFMAGKERSFA